MNHPPEQHDSCPGRLPPSAAAPARNGESGVALILVLGFLAVVSLLALHLATSSELAALQAKVLTERNHLKYGAESAAERACWLVVRYHAAHPGTTYLLAARNARPGNAPPAAEEPEDEPWQADGTSHAWKSEGMDIHVQIFDADNGIDLSGPNPAVRLRRLPVFQATDGENTGNAINGTAQQFLDTLADYVDRDDFPRLQGKERQDYAAEGFPDLPRNGPLQMREEALWLAGVDMFSQTPAAPTGFTPPPHLDMIRIIPPRGVVFRRNALPNFFAADPNLIRSLLPDLDEADIALVLDARRQWRQNRVPLPETLPPVLFTRVRRRFSFNESGIVTIRAVVQIAGIQRTLLLTRDVRTSAFLFRTTRPWLVNWQKFAL